MAKLTGVRRRCTTTCGPNCRRHKFEWHLELPAGPDGKRRQFTGTEDTAEAASQARAELLAQYKKGTLPSNDSLRNQTVAEYLDRWYAGKVASGKLRASTARSYRAHLDRHLIPHLGMIKLRDLRAPHIEAMFSRIRRDTANNPRPVGPSTETRIFATLRSAIGRAVKTGELPHDHTKHVELATPSKRRRSWWTVDQFWAYIDRLDMEPPGSAGHRLHPIVLVAAGTGLRIGELLGLRWVDVDLDDGYLTVHQQAQQVGNILTYGPPKTRAGEDRDVPLVGWVPDALRNVRRIQAEQRLAFGPDWANTGLVFTAEDGTGLMPHAVSKAHHKLVTTPRAPFAPLPPCRFHDLRHLAATLLLQEGLPMPVVSKILGHSSTAITDAAYNHVVVDHRVRDAMNEALNNARRRTLFGPGRTG